MFYVYILQSLTDKSYYTGYTTDLKKQFQKHNEGGQKYSSQKRPLKLKWYCAFKEKS